MTLSLFPATSPEPAAGPDVAYTPAALADTILRYLTAQAWHARCPWYYDPHCGDGAFLCAGADLRLQVCGSELDPAAAQLARISTAIVWSEDFLLRPALPHPQTVIVGNPPFSTAPEHLAHAIALSPLAIAWILPVQIVREMGAEYVIAVDLLPPPHENDAVPENLVAISLTSLYGLMRANQDYGNVANCTITPAIGAYSLIDLSVSEELIAAGRAAAEAALPTILAALHQPPGAAA